MLDLWRETDAFRTLWAQNRGNKRWSFIDGPITANGPMAVHHGWGRTYKDVFQRFKAMQGYDQRYQNGFDCQGLWVEVLVEKEKGFTSKRDIERMGLAEFVNECKQRVLNFAAMQTEQSIRLGYWMDWNDPEQLRSLRDRLAEDPNQVITVDGPHGPVTDTAEQIVGRLGTAGAGRLLLHLLQREQLPDLGLPQEVLGEGLALRGHRRHALVLSLRHRHQPARDRHRRLPGADPHQHLRPLPAGGCTTARRASTRRPACPRRCWSGRRRPGP